jgi:transporter family protein
MYIDPRSALIYESCGALLVGTLVFLSLHLSPQWHPIGALFAFSSGLAGLTGALCFLYAVTTGGKVSVVVTLTALYPIVTILLSFVFLQEQISLTQGIAILLALIAMVLFAL